MLWAGVSSRSFATFGELMNIATVAAIATTIITTIIAALVAVITRRQWVTKRARLRHELFDRRYAIYEEIAGFVAGVLQMGAVEAGGERAFLRQTKRAYFAFGCDKSIRQLVDDIYQQAMVLQTLQVRQKGLPPGNALNAIVDKQGEVLKWFNATLSSLEQRFDKYLCLEH